MSENRSALGAGPREGRDTAKPAADGFEPNRPGPQGFPLAGARFVRPLGRSIATRCVSFRADHLATGGVSELFQSGPERL